MDRGESMPPRFEGECMVWEIGDSADAGERRRTRVSSGVLLWGLAMVPMLAFVEWNEWTAVLLLPLGPGLLVLIVWMLDLVARMMASRNVRTRVELSADRLRILGELERTVDLDLGAIEDVRVQIHPMLALVFETRRGHPVEVLAGDHPPAALEDLADRIRVVLDDHRGFLAEQRAAEREHGYALRGVVGAVSSRSESQ